METITRKEAKAQGLKRYFTGKPCKRGHVEERLSSNGDCVECSREKRRQYSAENREQELERKRQHYAENREIRREYTRQYYAENREKRIEYSRQYYAENRDRELERIRQYRYRNPEYFRQYRAENLEKGAARTARRHAAKLDRTLSHDEELTQFVMEEAAQHAKDMEELFGTPFHVDHMIPMQGKKVSGLHVWYNLQVIPAHLNLGKGNRMRYTKPLEWLADAA